MPALEELAAADAKLDVEEEGTLPLLQVYDDGADPPSVSSDGDEGDEAPEEVPMRRVKKAARETRRKETEAKSGARGCSQPPAARQCRSRPGLPRK